MANSGFAFISPTGNWLNYNLYSPKLLSPVEQNKILEILMEYIKKHITPRKTDYRYSLELELFTNKEYPNLLKFAATMKLVPRHAVPPNEFFQFISAGTEDAAAGSAHVPISPVPPKGMFEHTGLIVISDERFQLTSATRSEFEMG